MFKIARTAKQIFRVLGNVPKSVSAGINNSFKYSSQSKGYIEDAADEFTFLKALHSQSIKPLIQDTFKALNLNLTNIAKAKTTQLLDPAETRKLIYARFADEISARSKNDEEKKNLDTKNLETKGYATKEHVEARSTYDITEEFKMFKEQGYDFAATREALQQRHQDTNQSSQSMRERMK